MKLEELKEERADDEYVEEWRHELTRSINDIEDDVEWDKVMNPYDYPEEYWKAAQAIVDPNMRNMESRERFNDWQENDDANWAGWIRSNWGDQWGDLADLVNEYGF